MGTWQSGWLLLTSSFLWETDELTNSFILSPKLCEEPPSSSSQTFPWPMPWVWDSHSSSACSLSHSSWNSFSIPQVWHGFTFLSKNSHLTTYLPVLIHPTHLSPYIPQPALSPIQAQLMQTRSVAIHCLY